MTVSVEEQPAVSAPPAPTPPVVPEPVRAQVERTIAEAREAEEFASYEDLVDKKRRENTFDVVVTDKEGQPRKLKMVFRALSGDDYDELVAKHVPTPKQKNDGHTWNPDTFPPALISAVSFKPGLTVDQVKAIWKSKDWSAGETGYLFTQALAVCQSGLSVPFSVSG